MVSITSDVLSSPIYKWCLSFILYLVENTLCLKNVLLYCVHSPASHNVATISRIHFELLHIGTCFERSSLWPQTTQVTWWMLWHVSQACSIFATTQAGLCVISMCDVLYKFIMSSQRLFDIFSHSNWSYAFIVLFNEGFCRTDIQKST